MNLWLDGLEPYGVHVSDPPWSYENETVGGDGDSSASAKYPTMPTTAIMELGYRLDRVLAARGDVPPTRIGRNVIEAPAREHSRKPDEFWSLIEQCLAGRGRRIETFAREARDGWDRWGDGAPAGPELVTL